MRGEGRRGRDEGGREKLKNKYREVVCNSSSLTGGAEVGGGMRGEGRRGEG